jgi:hypothetical protein
MNEPICIPNCDYVAGGPILHAEHASVKARLVPSARSVEVPQDQIHDVGLAVEQPEQTHPKQYARVAVPAARHAAQWHAHGVTPLAEPKTGWQKAGWLKPWLPIIG